MGSTSHIGCTKAIHRLLEYVTYIEESSSNVLATSILKNFSWKAEQKTAPHFYKIQGWLPNRYLPLVMFDSICIYKPKMKGGHTHNHQRNAAIRIKTRSKDERQNDKKISLSTITRRKSMSDNHYPLHPGQTEVGSYYVQVPQSEYESLKRENVQLHALIHGVKSQDSNAEIDTLANECRALRAMNAKAQEEIATLKDERNWLAKDRATAYNDLEKRTQESMKLKEAQRWRNFKNEPPEHHQWIEACYCEDRINERLPRIEVRRWDDGMKYDVFEQELYIGWRPLPKAPEVDNESNKV